MSPTSRGINRYVGTMPNCICGVIQVDTRRLEMDLEPFFPFSRMVTNYGIVVLIAQLVERWTQIRKIQILAIPNLTIKIYMY